jgi:class 3 adenylate cyclase/tetratricopeptide (TPR) repeat protein
MTGGRTLTVLVADLSESTRLAVSLGAERTDEVRRAVFARFETAAHQHAGTLVKTMGDGCLITYPGAAEGVAAGVELVEAINRLGRQVPGLRLRVGIAVGDLTEEDDDVFGDAVVLARRVCDAATPGQVLVTDVVRALAGNRGHFEWERIGNLFLKGIDEPVPCSAARESLDLEARGRLPRALRTRPGEYFVGRSSQLETLVRAWKETETGDRRVVVVSGEPGVGKTRLVAAAARRADDDGALVLFGRCEEDLAVPYQPFVDALRSTMEDAPRDLIDAHTSAHGGELRRLFPTLPAPAPVEAAPEVEQARVTAALADWLARVSADRPVVLVIDDLHWAAPATVQAVRHLMAQDSGTPLLVIATYRDTDIDPAHPVAKLLGDVARFDHAQRIALEGLDRREIEELIEVASGDALTPEGMGLAAAVFDRTGGNPFFVNQVLRHLAESGALVFHDGHWDAPPELTELPGGIIDVVRQRLARLSPNTKGLLATAAVAGERFTHALIGRAAHVDSIEDAINEALAARLLVDDGRGGYRFAHAILRDAVLASQNAAQRAAHHQSIAATLRNLYGDGLSAPLHELAYHLCGAAGLGLTSEAARFSLAAADKAMHAADVRAALEVLQRCWETIDAIEPRDHVARFDVCNRLAELHYITLDGVVDALEAAAESARVLQSAERLVDLAGHAYRWDVNVDDPFAMQLVDDALHLLGPEPTPLRALALANGAFLQNFLSQGNPKAFSDEALRVLDEVDDRNDPKAVLAVERIALSVMGHGGAARTLALTDSVKDLLFANSVPHIAPIFLSGQSAAYVGLGDRDGWNAVTIALDRYVARTGDPIGIFYALGREVIEALFDGRFDEAPALFTRALEGVGVAVANIPQVMAVWAMWLAFEQGKSAEIIDGLRVVAQMTTGTPGIEAAFAVHLAEVGNVDEARDVVAKFVAELPAAGHNSTFGTFVALMAMATAVTGDETVAQPLLDELAPWTGEIVIVPSVVAVGAADRFRGSMLSLLGRHDEAVAAIEAAIALESRLGAPPFVARSRYWLARALLARGGAGDAARAHTELETCCRDAESLGMALVAEAAAALLGSS